MFLWYNSFQTKFEIDTYLELSNNMSLCMGCMQEIGDNKICPSCGFDTTEKQQAPFLPYGTILQNRYIVGAGIGYDFKAFYIDAAYQNVSSEYNNPFIQGSFANNTGYFSNNYIVEVNSSIVSNVKNKKDNFFITLGWKF